MIRWSLLLLCLWASPAFAFWQSRDSNYAIAFAPDPNAVVIAPSTSGGSDGNACTVASPCLTLGKAQSVVQGHTDKTVYLRAGTYSVTAALGLGGSDAGETWAYYPRDAVDSPIINAGGTSSAIFNVGTNNIVFNGLTVTNATGPQIYHDDGSTNISNLTIMNCSIGPNSGSSNFSPLLDINGINILTIIHNYVHDSTGHGIATYAYQTGLTLDHVVIDSNVVLRTSGSISDSGGIYTVMPQGSGFGSYTACCVAITNNYVKDYGASGIYAEGIYLDGGSNHVTVTGNVVGPPNHLVQSQSNVNWTSPLLDDGNHNTVTGNIFDTGITGNVLGGWWYTGSGVTSSNHIYSGNILEYNATTQVAPFLVQNDTVSANYAISNNVYWNFTAGGNTPSNSSGGNATVSDSSPQVVNPQIFGYVYTIASGSPVYSSPVNFPPLVGNWGPPGYAIPSSGEPPNNPH